MLSAGDVAGIEEDLTCNQKGYVSCCRLSLAMDLELARFIPSHDLVWSVVVLLEGNSY